MNEESGQRQSHAARIGRVYDRHLERVQGERKQNKIRFSSFINKLYDLQKRNKSRTNKLEILQSARLRR